ncbi:pseudouridine synthase [Spirochaetia bacterium]|nr:pseudouridine synthase [Spirochaetia bacterium]
MDQELIAGADDDGRRLDRILRKALPGLPLSLVHRLLRKGRVLVDGVRAGGDLRVRAGAVIRVRGMADGGFGEIGLHDGKVSADSGTGSAGNARQIAVTDIPALDILFEGAGLLILNKPVGVAVHGENSLEEQVREYLAGKLERSLSFKPGPLHRLDKPTSGVIVFSRSLEGARFFSGLLRERRIRKWYLALLDGSIQKQQTWEDRLVRDTRQEKTFPSLGDEPGKPGRTTVTPLTDTGSYTLARLEIHTGRTHQIRAQAAIHGHPLAGDRKYGGSFLSGGLLLHAEILEFPEISELVGTEMEKLAGKRITAPVPAAFQGKIRSLFGENAVNSSVIP